MNLGARVSNLRSQGLSFSKEGLDFTLDVPDTRDVKEIFGTMASTIETQDGQLTTLQTELAEAEVKQQKARQEIIDWAVKKFEEMQKENDILKNKLENTKREFKNFTINIQGFDDEAPPKPNKQVPTEEPAEIRETGFAMFSTEQGAPPDILTASQDEDEQDPLTASDGAMAASVRGKKKTARKKTPATKLRSMWRKAINSIITKNRLTRMALGFTKTRVQKSQSLMARLDRLEDKMFQLPISLMSDVNYELNSISSKLTKEIQSCEQSVEKGRQESEESLRGVTLAITNVRGDVVSLDCALKDLSTLVESRTGSQSEKLKEMEALGTKFAETESLRAQNLRKKMKNLMTQMKSVQSSYERANAVVYGLMARNAIVAESGGEESIVLLLKLDAQLRQARESVASIESASTILSRLVSNLKEDIVTSRHGPSSFIDDEDRDDLVGACDHITAAIEKVSQGIRDAHEFCKQHDENLAERWMGFSSVIQAAKSTASLSAKLKTLQTELEEKPSQKTLEEAMAASATDLTPVANQITELNATILKQAEDISFLKAKVQEFEDKQSLASASKDSRPVSANTHSILPPISSKSFERPTTAAMDNAELSVSLQPMIKDIIDAYMKNWTAENLQQDGESVQWVDSQQDDDSWYQNPPSNAEEEDMQRGEEVDTEEAPTAIVEPEQPMMKESSVENYVPLLEDYPPNTEEQAYIADNDNTEWDETPVIPPSGDSTVPEVAKAAPKALRVPVPTVSPVRKRSVEPPEATLKRGVSDGSDGPSSDTFPPSASPAKSGRKPSEASNAAPESRPTSKSSTRPPSRQPSGHASTRKRSEANESPDEPQSGFKRKSSGSGRPPSAKIDPEVFKKIREDLRDVTSKIEAMYVNKMDAEAAESLLRSKADKAMLNEKADQKFLEAIEGTILKVTNELGDLRLMQEDALNIAKAQMAAKLDKALKELINSERSSSRGVQLAATKSLCLSCGREGTAKTVAIPTSPRGYLPSLNAHVSAGPDVLRGGFKMPVSAPSGSTIKHSKSTNGLPGSPNRPGTREQQRSADPVLFARSFATTAYDSEKIKSAFNDDDSLADGQIGMIRNVSNLPIVGGPVSVGAEFVRPMYRKGFPAKKSARAPIVFAHEIFDASGAALNMSKTLVVNSSSLSRSTAEKLK